MQTLQFCLFPLLALEGPDPRIQCTHVSRENCALRVNAPREIHAHVCLAHQKMRKKTFFPPFFRANSRAIFLLFLFPPATRHKEGEKYSRILLLFPYFSSEIFPPPPFVWPWRRDLRKYPRKGENIPKKSQKWGLWMPFRE